MNVKILKEILYEIVGQIAFSIMSKDDAAKLLDKINKL